MRRALRWSLGWAVVAVAGFLMAPEVLPTPMGGVAAQTQGRPEITRLRFEGNQTFPDRQLRNAILTRQTECRSFLYNWVVPFCRFGAEFSLDPAFYNPRTFRNDFFRIEAFYRAQGFRQVEVDTVMVRPTPAELEVTFRIREGEPVRIAELEVQGLSDLPGGSELARGLPVGVGDRLDRTALRAASDTIVHRLQDQGYPRAEVFLDIFVPTASLEAEVILDAFAGTRANFGAIEVSGNEAVSETVIRRMLGLREGDLYARERLFDAQRNLYSLEIFRHAAVEPAPESPADSVVPLQVRVSEGNQRRVRAGAGWNTADCFGTEVRWASRNFVGGARRMVLRGRLSNVLVSSFEDSICSSAGTGDFARLNGLVAAEFTQPWIFSPRNTLDAAVFVERQSVPDVYVRESLGLNLGLTRLVGRNTPVTLTYEPQVGRLDAADVFFCTNFLVCETAEIDVLASANVLAPLGIRAARDRTNRAVAPTGGYTAALETEFASAATFSDYDYQRVVGEVTHFTSLPGGSVLAARLRGGWLGASAFRGFDATARAGIAVAPPQKRFYAGGANSVRGFPQNQLGPRVVTVGVEDLLFPRDEAPPICAPEEVATLLCDASPLAEGDFESRPTGGNAVVEGSVELRFPIWQPYLAGGLFLDFGQVWAESDQVRMADVAFTPGIGLRYSTPIGPVRLDLAYRPAARQQLPVVTSAIRPWVEGEDPSGLRIQDPLTGERIDWVFVDALARFETPVNFREDPGFSLRQIQFQFSIGHAF
jgi:outer membrane protein insertion porin family